MLPDQAVIQNIKGREESFAVTCTDVTETVSAAKKAIDAFNDMLKRGRVAAETEPEACGSCPFRVVCADYWEAKAPDWPRFDVRGIVCAADELAVTVAVDPALISSAAATNSATVRVLITPDVVVGVGDEIAVVDLDRAGPGSGRMRWNSRLRSPSTQEGAA
jgi:hypothetical protein